MTSTSTRGNDLTVKLDVYGRSVPIYLLFDMKKQDLTVYSDPSERGYQTHTTVAFGKPVTVPAPFDFELDTSAFND
ncbi:Uma2 family endonuclease [Glycomyces sp. YM15]|uniref:Uma2 family endonuclease n=1 Tax=Glycomyces sp. YM15 TaxID=2800446 RepID=UPI001962FFB8|nr:Uma2 family endonuclease [Glycomyces sp. YM15]